MSGELLKELGRAAIQAQYDHHCATGGRPIMNNTAQDAQWEVIGSAVAKKFERWLRAQPNLEQGADGGWYHVTGADLADELAALRQPAREKEEQR